MTTTASGSATSGPASCRVASMPSTLAACGCRTGTRRAAARGPARPPRARRRPRRRPRCPAGRRGSSRSPVRTSSWSSATSTRMRHALDPARGSTAVTVQPRAGARAGLEGAAEQRGPLGHADEAVARRDRRRRRSGRRRRARSGARESASPATRTSIRVAWRAWRSGVGDRLLGEPVDRRVDRRRAGRRGRRRARTSTRGRRRRRAARRCEVGDARLRGEVGARRRRAGRRPCRASRRASREASASMTRERVDRRRPARAPRATRPGLGLDRRSPRRGGRPCRAARAPAARARAA